MLHSLFSVMPIFVNIFWVILLLLDEQKNNSKRFLVFFLSLSIVNYIVHWMYFNHQYDLYTFFDSIWVFTSLSGYPLYYYYIRLLTRDTKINFKWSWLLMPASVLSVFSACIYMLMSQQEVHTFVHGIMYHEDSFISSYTPLIKLQILRLTLFKFVFVIQLILSFYFGLKLIREYNTEINRFYSNIGGKNLSQIKWLLMFFVFASIISLISSIVGKDFFVKCPWLLAIPSITHSLYLFGIGYFGYKQNFTIEDFQKDIKKAEIAYKNQPESIKPEPASHELIRKNLLHLIEADMVFKNPDLRITDLSAMLNTNRTYISRIINDDLHTNFSDLINTARIEYAKKMLLDCSNDLTGIGEIAEMSGFSSDSSFYRIFKEKEGVSPGDFRKRKCE